MSKTTAADVMIDCLIEWGVDTVFGIPGDGINGLMESLRTRTDKIRFVQARHEEGAAFMAVGYAKYTGRLGVCLATSGPGGLHLLNGLYDAKLDGAPVLAITGHHFHDLIDQHSQQDVNLDRVFMDVAVYNTRVMGPKHVEGVTHLACRNALASRGVSHINFPVDFQSMPLRADNPSQRNVDRYYLAKAGKRSEIPAESLLREAASILNKGKKVVILAGQGALGATDELIDTAEKLGAPIVKALLGKACVPDGNPMVMGGIGLLGTLPSEEVMQKCDTLLMVGTSFPYMEYLPKASQAKCVQIDIDAARIGLRFPADVGLLGDSSRTLEALLPMLVEKKERSFLEKAQKSREEWWSLMKGRGERQDLPMKPQVVAWELGKRLAEDAIVSSDSGTITSWWARQIPAKRGQKFSLSGTLASMANGLPYTIAAQLAYPDRQCVAFVGDGGFSMLMAEFATAVRYKLPIKIVVISNSTLGQIKWEQMVFLGNPEYGCDLHPIDFCKFAEACGGRGYRIEDPKDCGSILDEALAVDGPVLIDAIVDKQEPPLPAKIEYEQAKHFAVSMARGEKYRSSIIKTVAKNRIKEMV
ncbi:thiamine pyrophosphate-dependent enzyme [Pelagicoccus sp. SDUM812002]|uniref:thiamine pyrophosphate-dependent enzyme n=1 Tax=Pelagicoccus sp. SDUM812002 TaxID=3041266 RepID=UPI00280F6C13|nr:thiamine pyrophosphate-dependent enzyme [Pelagicoccus sp. SDUM812002]MDQ8186202.1 thiamine pyrophosphate-binding protein [Pelagicoccus sp. SDUM812002]